VMAYKLPKLSHRNNWMTLRCRFRHVLIFSPLSPNFSAGVESRHSRVCEQEYAQAIRAPQVLQRHARS